MIHVNMESTEGVTLDTAGKFCPDNVRVVPSFDFADRAKRWIIELVGTKPNSSGIALSSDPWLAAHYKDPNLCFHLIKTSDKNNVYGNMLSNSIGLVSHNTYGSRMASTTNSTTSDAFFQSTSTIVGFMRVTQDGSLKFSNGSSVYFTDGTYEAIAWLA